MLLGGVSGLVAYRSWCRVCISALRVSGLQLVWGVYEPCHELVREVVELGVRSARGFVFTRGGDRLESGAS